MEQEKNIYNQATVFRSFRDFANSLPDDATKGKFYQMIVDYSLDGIEPVNDNSLIYHTFILIKPNIDKSNIKRNNGSRNKGDRNKEVGSRNKEVGERGQTNFKNNPNSTSNEQQTASKSTSNEYQSNNNYDILDIYHTHPRAGNQNETGILINEAINNLVDKGKTELEAFNFLLNVTKEYAKATSLWDFKDKKFIIRSDNWFKKGAYMDNPKDWYKNYENNTANSNTTDDDYDKQREAERIQLREEQAKADAKYNTKKTRDKN